MRTPNAAPVAVALVGLSMPLLGTPPVAASDVAFRVVDLRTTPPPPPGPTERSGADAYGPVAADGFALFGGRDPVGGFELFRSDGTAAGTSRIVDLATAAHDSDPRPLLAADGVAYLSACTPAEGCELWKSDGTAAGTSLLYDVRPGAASSEIAPLAIAGGRFYFFADDGVHGCEPWSSDGTTAGTRLLRDVRPGPDGSRASYSCSYADGKGLAGRLLFGADDGVHGEELWRSDGTEQGTYLLKSLVSGADGGSPTSYLRSGALVFFQGTDPAHGEELWVSDGSAAGTRRVRDLVPGPTGSAARPLGRVPGGVLVAAGRYDGPAELWFSDGSEAGTRLVRSFGGQYGTWGLSGGAEISGRFVFCADEAGSDYEPWASDGTTAGTYQIADLEPGADSTSCSAAPGHDGVYLVSGNRLWRTTGAPGSATLVATIEEQGAFVGLPERLAPAGHGTLFQVCYDDDFRTAFCRLWRTDGTAPGTARVFAEPPTLAASSPRYLTARAEDLVFVAEPDGTYDELLHTDGTAEGTAPFVHPAGFDFDDEVRDRASLPGGDVVFGGGPGYAEALWRTTGDQVALVFNFGGPNKGANAFVRAGDRVYFGADSAGDIRGLWVTDGSLAGTSLLRDDVTAYDSWEAFGEAWFTGPGQVDGEGIGEELWESAGTPATTLVHDLVPGSGDLRPEGVVGFHATSGSIAFVGYDDVEDRYGYYRLNPANDELERVRLRSPEVEYDPPAIAALGGRMLFFDLAPDGVCALWSSDGTASGTVRIKHVGAGMVHAWPYSVLCPTELVAHGGALYFTACGPAAGCELWRSDGTTAGTDRVADLVPGPGSSFPSALVSIGDRLYFRACTPAHGCEPWVTEGSAAGLHRLGDVAPGAASSGPQEFTASAGLVYFSADDGTGAELWAVPLEIFYDGFESGDRSRWDS